MTQRGILIASAVGLAFAIASAAVLPATINIRADSTVLGLVVALLGAVAAGIAGRVILGTRRVHRYNRAAIPILSAVSGFAFVSALSSLLISRDVSFGPAPTGLPPSVIIAIVVGIVLYLVAATVYGFAATRQGFRVSIRVRLLLLLLLSVLPYAAVLGLLGWVIVSALWKPDAATPAPAAASE